MVMKVFLNMFKGVAVLNLKANYGLSLLNKCSISLTFFPIELFGIENLILLGLRIKFFQIVALKFRE